MTLAVHRARADQSAVWCPANRLFLAELLVMLLCGADLGYSKKLIRHAKQMLDFGLDHPGSYMLSKQDGLRGPQQALPQLQLQ